MSARATAGGETLARFRVAVAEDLAWLADLHDRELDRERLVLPRELNREYTPFGFVPPGEGLAAALSLFSQGLADIPTDLGRQTLDLLAAEYADIYLNHSIQASPCESIWIDEDGLMMQEPMFQIRGWYRRHGLADARNLGRRAFLRDAVKIPGEYLAAASDESSDRYLRPGALLDGGSCDALFPFVPEIAPERCNGCDTCVRLCPQDAIRFDDQDRRGPVYVISAERCSGCGICSDLCGQDAVSIARIGPSVMRQIRLVTARCGACGAGHHVPAVRPETECLCWVCQKINHNKALYQVLD